jgi:hypothetical protein
MISWDPIHDDSVFRLTVSQPRLFAAGVVVDPFRISARARRPARNRNGAEFQTLYWVIDTIVRRSS